MSDLALSLAPDAAQAAQGWLKSLSSERRMSPKTLEAYARDLGQFAQFMAEHLGETPGNAGAGGAHRLRFPRLPGPAADRGC